MLDDDNSVSTENRQLLSPEKTLSQRVAVGGAWMFSLRSGTRLLGLVQTVILARLLVPHDFGLIGMAVLVAATLEALSQTGVESALIFRKKPDRRYLDTAWTITVIRAAILFGLAAVAAPAVAQFFDTAGLEPFVVVVAGAFFLSSLANVGVVYFRKDLEFGKQFVYELSGVLPNLVVSIVLAYLWRSAWALALGMVAGNAVQLVASYLLHPYRPRLGVDRGSVAGLYTYGKWLFGTNILTFLANKGDDLIVGRLLGPGPLGLYQMAFRLGEKPREDITNVISQVFFPAYALVREDAQRLSRGYSISLEATAVLTLPLATALIALAPEITTVVLGSDWLPMVPALRLLALAGAVRAILALGGNLSHGVGRPDMDFGMNMIRLVIMAIAIYPFSVEWGLEGAAGAVLLGLLGAIPMWVIISTRFAGLSSGDYVGSILPPLIGSGLMAGVIAGIKLSAGVVGILGLIGTALMAAAVYVAWSYLTWRLWAVGAFRTGRILRGALASDHH